MDAATIRAMIDYNAETGIMVWKKRNPAMFSNGERSAAHVCGVWNAKHAGKTVGNINSDGYLQVKIGGKLYKLHRLAWLHYYGEHPSDMIDHKNGDKVDNRISNLRIASIHQNGMNRGLSVRNTSGFKGVSWNKTNQKWTATIKAFGKHKSLGYFDTPEEAHKAYSDAAHKLHGEFARVA